MHKKDKKLKVQENFYFLLKRVFIIKGWESDPFYPSRP